MAAIKHDKGKLHVASIPAVALAYLAQVHTIGDYKYARDNWREGFPFTQLLDALGRHLVAYMMGEDIDPDNGQLHLAAIMWCAGVLIEQGFTRPDLDDRPRIPPAAKKILRWRLPMAHKEPGNSGKASRAPRDCQKGSDCDTIRNGPAEWKAEWPTAE